MRWEKIALREVADFRNGINFDKSAYSSGVKLIGVSNFGERFSPDYEELQEVDPKVVRSDDFLIDGDIVFVRSNGNKELVGRCMLITEPEYSLTKSASSIRARIRDTNQYDPTFFTYYFKSSAFRKALSGNAVGTNIQNLSQDRLSSHIAYVPTIEMQRKIASVLSAYDDLIENNQKQIKLLEEAAQRLYKEWFVDLRFPGHEITPIVDGIPEGWEVCKFSEIASIMSGGTPKTEVKEYYEGDIPFYTPKDSDGSFFVFDTITHISEAGLEHCNSQYYPEGTINITARGTVGKTTILAVPMAMNQSCYALKCDELNSPYYLFFSLNKEVDSLKTMANGGVFNTIIVKTFDSISLTIPTQKVLSAFNAVVSSIMQQIKAKMKQNIHLAEARDRLLPKLMSGELEV